MIRFAVHIVTLNGRVFGVYGAAPEADDAMAKYRAYKSEELWRPVGETGWSSDTTTSLARRAWAVDIPDQVSV